MSIKAKGTTFTYDSNVIAECVSVQASGIEVRTTETTHLTSTAVTRCATIADYGSFSIEFYYNPQNTTHQALSDDVETVPTEAPTVVFTMSDTSTVTGSAWLTSFEITSDSVEDVMMATAEFTCTGPLTWAPAGA